MKWNDPYLTSSDNSVWYINKCCYFFWLKLYGTQKKRNWQNFGAFCRWLYNIYQKNSQEMIRGKRDTHFH